RNRLSGTAGIYKPADPHHPRLRLQPLAARLARAFAVLFDLPFRRIARVEKPSGFEAVFRSGGLGAAAGAACGDPRCAASGGGYGATAGIEIANLTRLVDLHCFECVFSIPLFGELREFAGDSQSALARCLLRIDLPSGNPHPRLLVQLAAETPLDPGAVDISKGSVPSPVTSR